MNPSLKLHKFGAGAMAYEDRFLPAALGALWVIVGDPDTQFPSQFPANILGM